MSAVFSALFGTPLTATIFALEVISVGVFYYSALVPCIVASLAALAISNAFGIAPTHFTFALTAVPKLLLLRVAALAAVCSLMSILSLRDHARHGAALCRPHPEPVAAHRRLRRDRGRADAAR